MSSIQMCDVFFMIRLDLKRMWKYLKDFSQMRETQHLRNSCTEEVPPSLQQCRRRFYLLMLDRSIKGAAAVVRCSRRCSTCSSCCAWESGSLRTSVGDGTAAAREQRPSRVSRRDLRCAASGTMHKPCMRCCVNRPHTAGCHVQVKGQNQDAASNPHGQQLKRQDAMRREEMQRAHDSHSARVNEHARADTVARVQQVVPINTEQHQQQQQPSHQAADVTQPQQQQHQLHPQHSPQQLEAMPSPRNSFFELVG